MLKKKSIKGRKQTPGLGLGKITDELYKAEEGISGMMIPKKTPTKVTFYEQPKKNTSIYVAESLLARPEGFDANKILEDDLRRTEKQYKPIQKPLLNLERIPSAEARDFFDNKRINMLRLRSNSSNARGNSSRKSRKSRKTRKSIKTSRKSRKTRK